ncbi:hypothetical protein EON65_34635 [archaeon]|nr:MAG: hypothetical protein EON65_34635 [archaeon]
MDSSVSDEFVDEDQVKEEVLEGWRMGLFMRHRSNLIHSAIGTRLLTRRFIFWWRERGSFDAVFVLRDAQPLTSFLPSFCSLTIQPISCLDIVCSSLFCTLALSASPLNLEAQLNGFVEFYHTFLKPLPSDGARRYLTKSGEVIRFSRSMLDARLQYNVPLLFITDHDMPAPTLWDMMLFRIHAVTRRRDGKIRNRPVVCISCPKDSFVHWVSKSSYA